MAKDIRVVKPTSAEQSIIKSRLKKQYPQMFEPEWGDAEAMRKKAQAVAKLIKQKKKQPQPFTSTRTSAISRGLSQSLTEQEIKRLQGIK